MDYRKVDFKSYFGNAEIEIQLKTRNFTKGAKNWCWVIFSKKDGELYKKFYDQSHTFLFLVGVKYLQDEGRLHEVLIDRELPQVALIPGRRCC